MLFSWGLCRPQPPAPSNRGRGTLCYKPDISLANKTGQLDKLTTIHQAAMKVEEQLIFLGAAGGLAQERLECCGTIGTFELTVP